MSIPRNSTICYMTLGLLPKSYNIYNLSDHSNKEEFYMKKGKAILLYKAGIVDMILLDNIKIPVSTLDQLEFNNYIQDLDFSKVWGPNPEYDKKALLDFTSVDSRLFTNVAEQMWYFELIQIYAVMNVVVCPYAADAYSEIGRLLSKYSYKDDLSDIGKYVNPKYVKQSKNYFLEVLPKIAEKFANDELVFNDYDYVIAYYFYAR